MIIVTGAAGFIGSNLVWALNQRGYRDILLVDELDSSCKFRNLNHLYFCDLVTPDEFLATLDQHCEAKIVFHQGANAETTEHDGAKMMRQNFNYSKALFDWCQRDGRRFIYASTAATYGDATAAECFLPDRKNENPLNVYGFSKLIFDRFVEQQSHHSQVAGMRYFNVYGPQEAHKGRMASVPWHLMNQIEKNGRMKLFEGSEKFFRDFIHVDDIVSVNLFLMDNPEVSGLFNVGTGKARSFMEMGHILQKLIPSAKLETIPFPEDLKGRYQEYTCAEMSSLYAAGYQQPWISLEDGLADYHHHFTHFGGFRPLPFSRLSSDA